MTDFGNKRVQKLNPSSGVWTSYGPYSSGAGQFQGPSGIAVSSNFSNFVGLCPADQNRCAEFVDHADVDRSGKGKSYYLIKDDKVTEGDCSGQVSQKFGCALFDQTDNPTKSWHTTTTYRNSNDNAGVLASPVNAGGNDANIIMKVAQDRECGEWLKPLLSFSSYDEQSNAYKEITWGNLARCEGARCIPRSPGPILDANIYRQRGIGWYDLDYDGYSIPGNYPVDQLDQMNFAASSASPDDWRLVKRVPCGVDVTFTKNCAVGGTGKDTTCKDNDSACGVNGWCVNNQCVAFADGSPAKPDSSFSKAKQICRAYPEADSPFPSTPRLVGILRVGGSPFFKNAHFCDEDDTGAKGYNQCECDYRKVKYGDLFTKYWKSDLTGSTDRKTKLVQTVKDSPPTGICLGGQFAQDGKECKDDTTCGPGGVCELLKSSHAFVGLHGFCLEQDNNRHLNSDPSQNACLTWYPIESLAGAADINNQHTEALGDWKIQKNGGRYCLNSAAPSTEKSFSFAFSPAGISKGAASMNYTPISDQGFGLPQYKVTSRQRGTVEGKEYCGGDYWGAHSKVRWSGSQFEFGNQAGIPATDFPADLAKITIDDIEEIDVDVIYSLQQDLGGAHNITYSGPGTTIFKFPNLKNSSSFQPYYKVSTIASPRQPGPQTGVVTGGFYKDGTGSHFVMLYTSSDVLPDAGSSGTGINLPTNQTVLSQWPDRGIVNPGLKGSMATDQLWPLLTDKNGLSIWEVMNSNITDACPIPDHPLVADESNWYGGIDEPVLWHAFKMDFGSSDHSFNRLDTFFCGRFNNIPSGQKIIISPAPINCKNDTAYPYSNAGNDQVEYKITVKLRQICRAVTDARVNPAQNGYSLPNRTVPRTDNLWNVKNGPNTGFNMAVMGKSVYHDEEIAPFGSLDEGTLLSPLNAISLTKHSLPACSIGGGTIIGCPVVGTTANYVSSYTPGLAFSYFPYRSYSETQMLQSGINALSQLYANTAGNYQWNGASYAPTAIGLTNVTGGAHVSPVIHPLGDQVLLNGAPNYLEAVAQGFSITSGGITSKNGTIKTDQDSLSVSLDFFMFADRNQMPLRKVAIDWNDGSFVTPLTGYFRNKRGLIAGAKTGDQPTEACEAVETASDYGHIKDVTCDNAFFHITNFYSCLDTTAYGYTSNASLCDLNLSGNYPDGCCIFKPKVQVKDNWGWCNGSCTANNGGCYDNSWNGGVDQCSTDTQAWTPFAGQIVVKYIK